MRSVILPGGRPACRRLHVTQLRPVLGHASAGDTHAQSQPARPARVPRAVWRNPVCGDGVCTAPFEYPQFGPFGCLADCGPSSVGTTRVVVHIEASYGPLNALTTPIMQALFLQRTSYNLCFSTFDKFDGTLTCWFPAGKPFESVDEVVHLELDLPDADWTVVIEAPFGGVSGAIYIPGGGSGGAAAQANQTLASWGFCRNATMGGGGAATPPSGHRRRRRGLLASYGGADGTGVPDENDGNDGIEGGPLRLTWGLGEITGERRGAGPGPHSASALWDGAAAGAARDSDAAEATSARGSSVGELVALLLEDRRARAPVHVGGGPADAALGASLPAAPAAIAHTGGVLAEAAVTRRQANVRAQCHPPSLARAILCLPLRSPRIWQRPDQTNCSR